MLRKWILATTLMLAFAVGARADYQTTQVTLQAPYGGANDVSALVNSTGGTGSGLSFTASASSAVNTPVYATGSFQIATYRLFDGGSNTFQSASIIVSYAIEGHQIAPVGGASLSAMFTAGVIGIYAVTGGTYNSHKESTWGPNTAGSTLLYSATIATPPQATDKGPMGDPVFGGQPVLGQNQASFFTASGSQAVGAFPILTLSNPDLLFAPPQPFSGFQFQITENNALSGGGTNHPEGYPSTGYPTNAQLDANFATLAALDPGLGLTTGQFTALNYTGHANANGPNALQSIGGTGYPILLVTGVPEPASILLLSFGAIGVGFYARRQKKLVRA